MMVELVPDDVVTPLEPAPKLADAVGFPVFLKREDLYTGFGGGSKGRKTAALAASLRIPPEVVISVGSMHSNHLRSCSTWAHEAGAHLDVVVHPTAGSVPDARHLRDALGAREVLVREPAKIREGLNSLVTQALARGERPLVVQGGGHHLPGTAAYREVALRLERQCADQGVRAGVVVAPSGTGGTQAGLLVGVSQWTSPASVVGVSVGRRRENALPPIIEAASWLGHIPDQRSLHFVDDYLGPGYGFIERTLAAACRWAGDLTGLRIDPVYTGRVFEALYRAHPLLTPHPGQACIVVVTG